MNRRMMSIAVLIICGALVVAVLWGAAPRAGRGGDSSTVRSRNIAAPDVASPTPYAEAGKPFPPLPTVTLTTAPYPPPLAEIVTPSPSATPDPTRAALSASQWANGLIANMNARDSINAFYDGPFVLVDARDVYPGSMAIVSDKILMMGMIADVAAVIGGTFRESPNDTGRHFMLIVGDRGNDSAYLTSLSDNVDMLTSQLP